jgi:DNA primase
MNIHDIKQISITDYLQRHGYTPAQIKGINHWYCSPFRQEQTPSFKVNTERNQWYDFGTGEHGDIIDLVCAMNRCSTPEALQLLGSSAQSETISFSFAGKIDTATPPSSLKLLAVRPLTHPHLLKYISERCVSISEARNFCSEVNYSVCGRSYYAIGFPNDKGGWELRNPFFKGCIAPKAFTSLMQGSEQLQLFEGFMDFLSWRTIKPNDTSDVVVLNSLALLSKVVPRLSGYQAVVSFLDNDEAGRNALEVLKQFCPKVIDQSAMYRDYKDLNEWLVHQTEIKAKQHLPQGRKRGMGR